MIDRLMIVPFLSLCFAVCLTTTAQVSPEIMQVGEYHEGAIFGKEMVNFKGAWLAICRSDAGDQLVNVQVAVNVAGEQDGTRRIRVQASGCDQTVFLVRQMPALTAGRLETGTIDSGRMADGVVVSDFNGIPSEIRQSDFGDNGYRLTLVRSGGSQVLYTTEYVEESRGWGLIWSGDLDRDGAPDYLLHTSHKYSSHQVRLFTSKGVGADKLVKETAMIYVADAL